MMDKKYFFLFLSLVLLFSFVPLAFGLEAWLSPNNFLDPASTWNTETLAYDEDTGTRAWEDVSGGAVWGNWVYFNYTEVTGTKIRYFVGQEANINNMKLEVLNTSDHLWYNVYTGIPTFDIWVNVTFSSTTSNAMKYQFFNTHPNKAQMVYLYETDFLNVTVEENDPPVNDQCSITDLDDTDDLYAQKQLYTVDYDVSDPDGFSDIDYCEVRFKQGASTRAIFRYDEDTDTFSVESGGSEWSLDGSSSAVESGNTIEMLFKVNAQWDATEEADLEIECYVVDDEPVSDTDVMQTDYFDVISNLVTDSIECDDANDPDRVDVSSSIQIDFTVRYVIEPGSSTASVFYPPNAEFTSVSIYDSVNNNKGSDSTILNGDGSVTFTSESTVKSENYNLYIDMADADYSDGEESTTEAVISDRIKILTLTANNTTPNVDEYVELRVTLELEYDSHSLNDGVNDVVNLVDASSPSMTWDGGDNRWEVDDVRASPESVTYDEVIGSENTYGITAINMNGKSVVVVWGEVEAYYYLTVYFDEGLIFLVNGSSLVNGSENQYGQDAYLNCTGDPENTNWEFLGFERQTYNNFTVDNPIYIDLISNETIWAYSQIEGEPLLYETVWIFSLLWVCLLGFFVWSRHSLLRGGTVLVGFILGLTIHSSVATTLGSLLGFVVVCVNVGLLVSVLFEK